MNKHNAKDYLPLVQALADGKMIQCRWSEGGHYGEWSDVIEPDFAFAPSCYRIKPEPKLRPWKPEEVPVGAIVRRKNKPDDRMLITAVTDGQCWSGRLATDLDSGRWRLFTKCEHSIDGGKTWRPCGIMEEER